MIYNIYLLTDDLRKTYFPYGKEVNKLKNKKIVAKSHHKMRKKTRTFQITHDIIKLCKINGVC